MTDAEKALIEACLASDYRLGVSHVFGLAQQVASERLNPALVAEYKEKLRAEMRARRELAAFEEKMPKLALGGNQGLTIRIYEEIEKEEGWT